MSTQSESQFWRQLASSEALEQDYAQAWLSLLSSRIDEALCAVLITVNRADAKNAKLHPMATVPQDRVMHAKTLQTARLALEQGKGIVDRDISSPRSTPGALIAMPISAMNEAKCILVVELSDCTPDRLGQIMRELQWAEPWMHKPFFLEEIGTEKLRHQISIHSLEIIADVSEQRTFREASNALVTEMARRYDCERVSLGIRARQRTLVRAISHSAQFSDQMVLVDQFANMMDEAIDQKGLVSFPDRQFSDQKIVYKHEQFIKKFGASNVLTIPLIYQNTFFGAVLLERTASNPFTENEVAEIESLCALHAYILHDKIELGRSIFAKNLSALAKVFEFVVGAQFMWRKVIGLAVIALLALSFFWKATDYVRAPATLRTVETRQISAPFTSYISEVYVTPGDLVRKGELLFTLDDRDLLLEELTLFNAAKQLESEYREAQAAFDSVGQSIKEAQIDQNTARLELVRRQLELAKITAPFDGRILSGDLTQSVGAAVDRGDGLMALAMNDFFQVILEVQANRIDEINAELIGDLVLQSMPEQTFTFEIDRVTPVAKYKGGRTFYNVYASFAVADENWRAGMEGVGKIDMGENRFLFLLTRDMLNWIRMQIWRWVPA